jgi:hypothetical protein
MGQDHKTNKKREKNIHTSILKLNVEITQTAEINQSKDTASKKKYQKQYLDTIITPFPTYPHPPKKVIESK